MIRYSIEKKYTTFILLAIILILGYVSYTGLSMDLLPDLELPILLVVAQDTGQTPEAMELKVTRPLERVLSSSEGLKEMQSFSTQGQSMIVLNYHQGHNMDSASIDVSGKIDLLAGLWSTGQRPMVLRLNPSMLPVMISAVSSKNLSPEELTKLYEERIQSKLEGTDGVARVDATGLFKKEVQVVLSEEKIHRKNKELLNKIQTSLDEKEEEIQQAREKIQQGKDQLANVSMPSVSVQIPDGLLDASMNFTSELTEISLKKSTAQVYLSSLEQVLLLLNTPAKDLNETQAKILMYLSDWPFSLTPENLKEAKVWTQKQIEETKGLLATYEAQEASIKEKLEEVTKSIESMMSAQSEMMSQAGNRLLQAQVAGSELTKMEVMLESQTLLLESKKEEALAKANLSQLLNTESLKKLLIAQNVSLPIGYVTDGEGSVALSLKNPLTGEEIPELLLVDTGEEALGKIYVKDVATVETVDNSKTYYAKVDGKNALLLNIQKQSLANTSQVSKDLHQSIEALEKEFPGLRISPIMDQGLYIRWVNDAILQNILLGGVFAMVILMVFLRDWRSTLLIALSIPVSIVAALVLMYFFNMTLNLVSLAGLALGVGMMVDNSIVVIENTHRLSSLGYAPKKAALEGAKEMAGAITASTLTTAFVFLPIVFTRGVARELFTDMALTIAFALFASLLVALSFIPTVSSLQPPKKKVEKQQRPFYRKTLSWSLKHPFLVLGMSLMILLGSFYFLLQKGSVFIPPMDTPQISMTLRPLRHTQTQEDLYKIADQVFVLLEDMEDLDLVGAMDTRSMTGGKKGITVNILRKDSSKKSSQELETEIYSRLKDLPVEVKIQSRSMSMDALGGSGLSLRIFSRDLARGRDYGKILVEKIKNLPEIKEISLGEEGEDLQYVLQIDKEKAMEYSLTPAEIFYRLEKHLAAPKSLLTLEEGLPLKVRSEKNTLLSKRELMNMEMTTSKGDKVRLSTIATLKDGYTQPTIQRMDQKRYVEINGSISKDSNIQLISGEIDMMMEESPPPEGVEVVYAGEQEQLTSTMEDLKKMLALALVIIYGIMVIQFQSLSAPFIVMFTIPLAFSGGALALLAFQKPLSVIAVLGFLVLSGVVVNNGIVFVDTARKATGSLEEVLIQTGYVRIRPIFMTAITTILGLFPLAMSWGLGSETLQPMGLVIIGGLLYATVMTLYVIPVLYKLFFQRKKRETLGY